MEQNVEKNIDQEELRKLKEAAWAVFRRHWQEAVPRVSSLNELLESGNAFKEAIDAFIQAGGSWKEWEDFRLSKILEKK